ncbi:hypothetical protein AG1IA_04197 [Rhizoctonia solani AG-1 IA]|uniref:Uncharacterized protein n=1 Tax=Thanatephorus cucumeris (strain AG1-IA) TaxID=983506 RepID=L8WZK3_THACA|nr:hypothetical protein AG1IA_04197 [Rhizoctonia solani AG-1 IA]
MYAKEGIASTLVLLGGPSDGWYLELWLDFYWTKEAGFWDTPLLNG